MTRKKAALWLLLALSVISASALLHGCGKATVATDKFTIVGAGT